MTHPVQNRAGGQVNGTVPQVDLRDVAEGMRALSSDLAEHDLNSHLQRLVDITVERMPGARWASVSAKRAVGSFTTPASTDEAATRADVLQYKMGSGPCVDAVLEDSVFLSGDVTAETRWPEWGHRVASEVGVRSVFSQRLHLLDDAGLVAGLNVYSDKPAAFDDEAVGMGLVLATHASMVLSQTIAKERAANLGHALKSNREIGLAMGILMQEYRVTREQAFDLLRVASQDTNRKLADIAADVADTGVLTIRRRTGSTSTAAKQH